MIGLDEVEIGSQDERVVLSEPTSTDSEGWRSFRVTLHGSGLTASRIVSDHVSLDATDRKAGTMGLERLIQETADEYRGWEGAKEWTSLEAQLWVRATTDRTGHATFEVRLFESAGGWGWEARVAVVLDVMERERVAKRLRSFFGHRAV